MIEEPDRYLEAFAAAGSDSLLVHVENSGDLPDRLQRIKALGKRPRAEVAQHLADAAIFCLPSLAEPSAVASVEAMAFRLPVVATQIGGFPEMVADGKSGTLVPPNE